VWKHMFEISPKSIESPNVPIHFRM
jgi:hypothetical protein